MSNSTVPPVSTSIFFFKLQAPAFHDFVLLSATHNHCKHDFPLFRSNCALMPRRPLESGPPSLRAIRSPVAFMGSTSATTHDRGTTRAQIILDSLLTRKFCTGLTTRPHTIAFHGFLWPTPCIRTTFTPWSLLIFRRQTGSFRSSFPPTSPWWRPSGNIS